MTDTPEPPQQPANPHFLAGLDLDGIKPHRQMGSPTRLQTRPLPAAPPRQRPRFDITASQQAFVGIDSEPAIADLGWQATDFASGTADPQGLDLIGLHIDRGGSVSSPNQQLIA